jgi:hypothetical protein
VNCEKLRTLKVGQKLSAVVTRYQESDMTKSIKSEQLRIQLKALNDALVPDSARGRTRSLALKVIAGEDRVHGESA